MFCRRPGRAGISSELPRTKYPGLTSRRLHQHTDKYYTHLHTCHLSSESPRQDTCQHVTEEEESINASSDVASLKFYDAAGPNPSSDGSSDADKTPADGLKHLHIANKKKPVNLAQWNVRGLGKLGKLQIVSNELVEHGVGIAGLSEIKWKGNGHFRTVDNHLILYSGKDEGREHHGVAIWVDKKMASSLVDYGT